MALARITTWSSGDVLTASALNAEFDNIVNNSVQQVALSSLTASSFAYLNASKLLATTSAPTHGQLLIGSTGGVPLLGAITGTAAKITVTLGSGTIALTIPDVVTLVTPTVSGVLVLSALTATTIVGLNSSKEAVSLAIPLIVANGGTGAATFTTNGVMIGNGTSAMTVTAEGASNTVLHGVTGGDPTFSAIVNGDITNTTIDLTTKVTGTLPLANGGTSFTSGLTNSLTFIVDGGGSAITTGLKGDITIPFACTITEWTILPDQSGSIVFDIWKDAYANYPPTVADTITSAAKPTLTATTKAQSSTLSGWTTSIAAGDTLRFNVDSITTCTRVTLSLKVTRTSV